MVDNSAWRKFANLASVALVSIKSMLSTMAAMPMIFGVSAILFIAGCKDQSQGCSVSTSVPKLTEALCNEEPDEIRHALATMPPSEYDEVAHQLLAIWTQDGTSVGSVPEAALSRRQVRLAFAPFIAHSIRNRRIDFPLSSFQKLGSEAARASSGTLEQVQGIQLLGSADAATEIPFLKELVINTVYPEAAHAEAIRALGRICDAEALATLVTLRQLLSASEHDRVEIEQAIGERAQLNQTWCGARHL